MAYQTSMQLSQMQGNPRKLRAYSVFVSYTFFAVIPPKAKPFFKLQWRQRQSVLQAISDTFPSHCPSLSEAEASFANVNRFFLACL